MKHRRGFETAKAAATAETARRRMRHRVQGSDRKNSRSSAWDFASDWQANTYAQNALNQAAFGHGWHRLRDCDPHLNRPTARQANRPRATSPTNPNSITAPILAGLMEFEDRAEPRRTAVDQKVRRPVRNAAGQIERRKTARRSEQREWDPAKGFRLADYSLLGRRPCERGSHPEFRRDGRQEENGRAGRQVRLRSILREDYEVLYEDSRFRPGGRVRTLPGNFANRSPDTQAAAGGCARVASNERFISIN